MRRFVGCFLSAAGMLLLPAVLMAQGEGNGPRGEGEGRPSPEEFFNRIDSNKDGKLSADDAGEQGGDRLKRLIERADADKDGSVTKEEFTKAGPPGGRGPGGEGRGRGPGGERPNPEAFFKTLDKNSDGQLSSDEAQNEERFKRLVERADDNKDGKVSSEEFVKSMPAGGPGGRGAGGERPNPEEFFNRIDSNKDGSLSADDAGEQGGDRLKRLIERADTDKDGKVSKEEFLKAGPPQGGNRGRRERGNGPQRPEADEKT